MQKKIAVILDMDGVMVESNPFHKYAWYQFCKEFGFNLSEQDLDFNIYGKTNKDALDYLFKKDLSHADVLYYSNIKENIYRNIYQDNVQPVSGLIPFLDAVKKNQLKLAIATSNPPENVDFLINKLHVRNYFDIIIDSTYLKKGKPDPEIYLKTAMRLKIAPIKCIVFEDSISGVQSALDAGMKVVGVLTTHDKQTLRNAHAHINNFSEIIVENILKYFKFL